MATMWIMKKYPKIVVFTSVFCFLTLLSLGFVKNLKFQPRLKISLQDQPSIGNGNMQMVVFEDFTCTHCKDFTLHTLPRLHRELISTNKASLILVPVCFHEGSKPATNAALAVYQISKERFLDFVRVVVEKKPYFKKDILQIAEIVGGIDLEALSQLIDGKVFYEKIEQNLTLAINEIGPDFGTPTLFVDGEFTPIDSLELKLPLWKEL